MFSESAEYYDLVYRSKDYRGEAGKLRELGYLLDDDSVRSALAYFKNHLSPGGAVFIEPWLEPDSWSDRPPDMITAEDRGRKVCRVMRSKRDCDKTFLEAHYLFVNESDIKYATECHVLRLLSREQWFSFFHDAGLHAEYLPEGLTSRGLYILRDFEQLTPNG